jgi:hypothetical protein
MSDADVAAELAAVWTDWQDEEGFPFTADHCINGTRVAVLALAALNVKARPISVSLILFNAEGWRLWGLGVPAEEWPEGAWSIGRVPEAPDPQQKGKWKGHLMCEGDGWTLDVSARQFHRPELIEVPAALVIPENLPDEDWATYVGRNDQVLMIRREPTNNGWRQAPGWKRLHRYELMDVLARMGVR